MSKLISITEKKLDAAIRSTLASVISSDLRNRIHETLIVEIRENATIIVNLLDVLEVVNTEGL